MAPSKVLLLFALCFAVALPGMAFGSRIPRSKTEFVVQGRVFCDTCRAGFETAVTSYIPGAKVKVECRDRHSGEVTRSIDGTTDTTGTYNILVTDDHANEVCESVLISSPDGSCNAMLAGRDRSSLTLTHNNGIPASLRYANSMGFVRETAMGDCDLVMQLYKQDEDEI